jgi:hypothetical protein
MPLNECSAGDPRDKAVALEDSDFARWTLGTQGITERTLSRAANASALKAGRLQIDHWDRHGSSVARRVD